MRFAVTATSEAMFKIHPLLKIPASFFCREAEVLFGALKTKSCLSVSEFFFFRKKVKILASEREPRIFFVSFLLFVQKK